MTHNRKQDWYLAPLIIFIVFRALILSALYYISGGSEFAMDWFSFDLGLEPFSVITFQNEVSGFSQPPLYPMFIALFAIPLSKIFNNFIASRITFIILELIMFILMIKFLSNAKDIIKTSKRNILMVLSFSPLGFMVSTVMRQEEAIVAIFTVAVMIAYQRGSIKAASFLTLLGMITAKILFGVVFVALLLYTENKRDVFKWGIFPVISFYLIYMLLGYMITDRWILLGFSPPSVVFCSTIYSLLLRFVYMSGPFMKWSSLILLGVSFWVLWLKRSAFKTTYFPQTVLLVYSLLFLLFYHINTDYYIYFLPVLALIPFTASGENYKTRYMILHILLAIASWGFGIAFGLRVYADGFGFRFGSKDMLINIYQNIFGIIPIETLEISQLGLTVLIMALLTTVVTKNIFANKNSTLS